MNNRSQDMGKTACTALLTVVLALLTIAPMVFAAGGNDEAIWETWTSESYTMAPRESFQLQMNYKDISTRRWLLVVDGGDDNCDLSVLRVKGEELLYYKTNERRHEVSIPWGIGEEIILVLKNRDHQGAFVVSVLGPPKEQNFASYSYPVNRALEAYSTGQVLRAKDLCRTALVENPDDGVAKVLLAGFLRESHGYAEAEVMIDEALDSDLPPDMRTLAENLAQELEALRAPLPRAVRKGLAKAEEALGKNHPQEALEVCDELLSEGRKWSASSRGRLHVLRGRALEALGRNFEAVDAFTQALNNDRSKAAQAEAYYYMGSLYLKMGNLTQAEGAYSIALQFGLPTGLEVQALEDLKLIQDRLDSDR
jgi:tetratricopeptide (TPR) repeat protein